MNQAAENRAKIDQIKADLHNGRIDYAEATRQTNEILEAVNAKGQQIAKKYGKRYRPITAREVLR